MLSDALDKVFKIIMIILFFVNLGMSINYKMKGYFKESCWYMLWSILLWVMVFN
ncbi:hypothetical protein J2Z32_003484 [Paenibacillus turicensis]|uniref:Uncharacterized protein n=1 Tax=Paenibacillus turicensis TaxID=160487 RepID=A0ABS4FWB9_9BACL|nr:hypothetical protein [Paenibacillus turicensis]